MSDYHQFPLQALQLVPHHPISFEVFSDDLLEMERQAHEIASWGPNVYVKIPVTNTLTGTSNGSLAAVLGDNTGASSLTKSGSGTWTRRSVG